MPYNYFPVGYQSAYYPQYYPQVNAQQNMPQNQAPVPTSGIIWVQGEAGAKSYMVAPNTTVQLWDSEKQTIYIKSADSSGMPSIKTIDYTIRGNNQSMPTVGLEGANLGLATKDDINTLSAQIDALQSKIEAISGKPATKAKKEVVTDE